MNLNNITTIAFDADDTLWVNEPYFRESEELFYQLVKSYMPKEDIMAIVYKINIDNLTTFGYGIKSHMLNMIEALGQITNNTAPFDLIQKATQIGLAQISKPIELLPDIELILSELSKKYRLVVATKGELLEQNNKFKRSNIQHYFEHIEVMYEKDEDNYNAMLKKLNCRAENFLMIGNSMKSDIIPVLNIGGTAIHIPFHTTWEHEMVNEEIIHERLVSLNETKQLLNIGL